MAVQSLVLACSSTPQVVAGSFGSGSVHGYIRVRLRMVAGTGYFGDSGVTTGTGFALSSGDAPIQEVLLTGETLYVASSSGATASVGILRTNETT